MRHTVSGSVEDRMRACLVGSTLEYERSARNRKGDEDTGLPLGCDCAYEFWARGIAGGTVAGKVAGLGLL